MHPIIFLFSYVITYIYHNNFYWEHFVAFWSDVPTCFSSCAPWCIKAEKILVYVGGIVGYGTVSQLISWLIPYLLGKISQTFFKKELRENVEMLQGSALILSHFGITKLDPGLEDLWFLVMKWCLCLRNNNCSQTDAPKIIQNIQTLKAEACYDDPKIPIDKGSCCLTNNDEKVEISTCETFFNELPLLALFALIVFLLVVLFIYGGKQSENSGSPPNNTATGAVNANPIDPYALAASRGRARQRPKKPSPSGLQVDTQLFSAKKAPKEAVVGPGSPATPTPMAAGSSGSGNDGGPDKQTVEAKCGECGENYSVEWPNPVPSYCSSECVTEGRQKAKEDYICELVKERVEEAMKNVGAKLCDDCKPIVDPGRCPRCPDCNHTHRHD